MTIRAASSHIARWIFSHLVDYDYKFRHVKPYLGTSVLDIGCGGGTLISFLEEGASYAGIDVDRENITRLKVQRPQHAFYCLDLDKDMLPDFSKDSFSSIVLLAVIEHLKSPDLVLSQCRHLMRDHTLLIISTPTRMGDLASKLFEGAWETLKDTPVHPHVRIYNRETLCAMGRAAGLICKSYERLGWHRQNQLFVFARSS